MITSDSLITKYKFIDIKTDIDEQNHMITSIHKTINGKDYNWFKNVFEPIYDKYYISNFKNDVRLIVEEAIRLSMRLIHIDDKPMPAHNITWNSGRECIKSGKYNSYDRGLYLDTHFSIYVRCANETNIEIGNFWTIFRELESSLEWKIQLQLTAWGKLDEEAT